MPLVQECIEQKERHSPWWVVPLLLLAIAPIGLFGLSFYQPVTIPLGTHEFAMETVPTMMSVFDWQKAPGVWGGDFVLPLHLGKFVFGLRPVVEMDGE